MTWIEWFEALSYVVTVFGFPLAIGVFVRERRRERENEESELNQRLSDEYQSFLRLVLDNADLKLFQEYSAADVWTDEQKERKGVLFEILTSVFERAYITLYDTGMGRQQQRRWLSWEDDMRAWCRRPDFRAALPSLLEGEDDEFSQRILKLAAEESRRVEGETGSQPG